MCRPDHVHELKKVAAAGMQRKVTAGRARNTASPTYPLVRDGRLAGLVTLNRVRSSPVGQRPGLRLADIACAPDEVPTARPGDPLTDLLPRMPGCADGRAVVLDDERRVLGLITPSDISRAVQTGELRGTGPHPPPRGADLVVPHDRRPWTS